MRYTNLKIRASLARLLSHSIQFACTIILALCLLSGNTQFGGAQIGNASQKSEHDASKAVRVKSIRLATSVIVGGGQSTIGVVILNRKAPEGGCLVRLASSDAALVQVPATLSIPEGRTSTAFTVGSASVESEKQATLTAEAASASSSELEAPRVQKSFALMVRPPGIASISFLPETVIGGDNVAGFVTFDLPSKGEGVLELASSEPQIHISSTTISLKRGDQEKSFEMTTSSVKIRTKIKLSFTYDHQVKTAFLVLEPKIVKKPKKSGRRISLLRFPSITNFSPESILAEQGLLQSRRVEPASTLSHAPNSKGTHS